jgi:hypothetical protein
MVLIVAMIVSFALAGIVLVLCRTMRVESAASANLAAAAQASAVARGAEQYVVALISQEGEDVRDLAEENFAGVRVGEGMFWIMRPDYDDEQLPLFGLIEEASKLNVGNDEAGLYDKLLRLPGMTDVAASSILDWIDADQNVERDGAEMEFYLNHPSKCEPYYPKNGPMETVEEMLMVRGVDRVMLYGDGTAPPLGQRAGIRAASSTGGGAMVDRQLARGIFELVTVYSRETNTGGDTGRINISNLSRLQTREALKARLRQRLPEQQADQIMSDLGTTAINDIFQVYVRAKAHLKPGDFDLFVDDITTSGNRTLNGRINVNTAPPAVLMCLNGLEEGEVDKLLARRQPLGTPIGTPRKIEWVADALTPERAAAARLGAQLATRVNQWSADILAVSGNGRAFKRVRIVVDNRSGTPEIKYRRDLTNRGWPMDKSILARLRSGEMSSQPSQGSMASSQQQGRF